MIRRIIFLIFSLLLYLNLYSQSLTGTNGLLKIPSADIFSDGTFYIGASLLPKGSYNLYGSADRFDGMPTFMTLSLYDRVEIMFRYTHQLGQTVSPETEYFPDRMFSIRYNIFKGSKVLPKLTLGLHDVSEALGATSALPYFASTYLVANISFKAIRGTITTSLGYGFDVFGVADYLEFDGFFGGVEYYFYDLETLSFVAEYDTQNINIGVKSRLTSFITLGVGLLNMNKPSGFLTFNFEL
jgi:hypothetical protein